MKKELNSYKDVKTYADFVEFYGIKAILNNSIIEKFPYEYQVINGELETYYNNEGDEITLEEYEELEYPEYDPEPVEIYQYYIVSESDANLIADYTDDIVFYIPEINVYLWAITHYGTAWDYVPITLNVDEEDIFNSEYVPF